MQEQGKIRWYECIVKKKFIICLALMMAFWGGDLITNPHKGDLSISRPERYSFRAVLVIREM